MLYELEHQVSLPSYIAFLREKRPDTHRWHMCTIPKLYRGEAVILASTCERLNRKAGDYEKPGTVTVFLKSDQAQRQWSHMVVQVESIDWMVKWNVGANSLNNWYRVSKKYLKPEEWADNHKSGKKRQAEGLKKTVTVHFRVLLDARWCVVLSKNLHSSCF